MNTKLTTYKIKNSPNNPSIIMLHGYGANAKDLIGLCKVPKISKLNLNWYFIEAPLSPPELAIFGGKAWFNPTLLSFNPNMNAETLEKFYSIDSKDYRKSLQAIKDTIWSLNLKNSIYVGGFSQGAMMASNIFMSNVDNYTGLIALSGAPLGNNHWEHSNSPKKVFISHGKQDPVLPFKCGKDLSEKLTQKGLIIDENWFQGKHEIPIDILNKLGDFLS